MAQQIKARAINKEIQKQNKNLGWLRSRLPFVAMIVDFSLQRSGFGWRRLFPPWCSFDPATLSPSSAPLLLFVLLLFVPLTSQPVGSPRQSDPPVRLSARTRPIAQRFPAFGGGDGDAFSCCRCCSFSPGYCCCCCGSGGGCSGG